MLRYLKKFPLKTFGKHLIIHSHLPPLNSRAYTRFLNEHLIKKSEGPTHAQIGLTNACPQKCEYCYNKERTGEPMNTETIKRVIKDLMEMGVVWIGFTGGEPLLNKDIIEITGSISENCAVKLFTTGCTLTKEKAKELKNAGIFSVSVSIDHWIEEKHDGIRGYKGAFQEALKALEILKETGGIHVSVSAVLSPVMIKDYRVEEFLKFLIDLEVDEAWISETKPSVKMFWDDSLIITGEQHDYLKDLQDRYNKESKIVVNYLGHFEAREYFGCNAGNKMVYIDAFGDVSPCVFTPISFGNVKYGSIKTIFKNMKKHFKSSDRCFINENFKLLQKYSPEGNPLSIEDSIKMMKEAQFGNHSEFFKLYYK